MPAPVSERIGLTTLLSPFLVVWGHNNPLPIQQRTVPLVLHSELGVSLLHRASEGLTTRKVLCPWAHIILRMSWHEEGAQEEPSPSMPLGITEGEELMAQCGKGCGGFRTQWLS